MNGAGTTLGHPAAELGAGEPQHIAQHPEQGHIVGDIDVASLAVDDERYHLLRNPRKARHGFLVPIGCLGH